MRGATIGGSGSAPLGPGLGPGIGTARKPPNSWMGPGGSGWSGYAAFSFVGTGMRIMTRVVCVTRDTRITGVRKSREETRTYPDHPDPWRISAVFRHRRPGPRPGPTRTRRASTTAAATVLPPCIPIGAIRPSTPAEMIMLAFSEYELRRCVGMLGDQPEMLAQHLRATIARGARVAPGRPATALTFAARCLRHRLADLFAARHGWRQARTGFSVRALAAGMVRCGDMSAAATWSLDVADHAFFFRTEDRRPVAVAGHLYNLTQTKRPAIQAWATRRGLHASFPTDFPSWWCPGATAPCLYVRHSDGGRA